MRRPKARSPKRPAQKRRGVRTPARKTSGIREAGVDLIMAHAGQLVTLEPATLRLKGGSPGPRRGSETRELGIIKDGAVAVRGDRIVDVGPSAEVMKRNRLGRGGELLDARGMVVCPGFVDCHTHAVFAGQRAAEFEMRLQGSSYMEIAAAGGGILSSVRAFREEPEVDLFRVAWLRMDRLLEMGTTTVEIKSGYGLSLMHELKALSVIGTLSKLHRIGVVATFLGAHEVPEEFRGNRPGYVRSVIEEQIPRVSCQEPVTFCDVFCEKGVFTVAESRRILKAGMAHGLRPKVHAEEFARTGGAMLASELGAVSADHLLHASEADIRALRDAGVVAVLLPGTSFSLGLGRYAPARAMIEAGLPVALATDCNPGSSMTESMQMMMTLACVEMRMTAAEALTAATINSAFALALGTDRGSLAIGKRADLVVMRAEDYREIPYHYGVSNVRDVIKNGKIVVRSGRRC